MIPNKFFVKSCFFIYAMHTIPFFRNESPIAIGYKLVNNIVPLNHFLYPILLYLIVPLFVVGFCMLLYWVMSKCCPVIASVLSGNRS